jgi:hypothetical protein
LNLIREFRNFGLNIINNIDVGTNNSTNVQNIGIETNNNINHHLDDNNLDECLMNNKEDEGNNVGFSLHVLGLLIVS